MLVNLKIICQFHAHSVYQNSVEIFWAEIIYRGRLLTLITRSSSRLLRIRFSADLTMYWFPVCYFRCMKFKPLVIWIWNQNIAISTIVGTSSHNKTNNHNITEILLKVALNTINLNPLDS
jgi:aromatic ring-cleaving dioxygenase